MEPLQTIHQSHADMYTIGTRSCISQRLHHINCPHSLGAAVPGQSANRVFTQRLENDQKCFAHRGGNY